MPLISSIWRVVSYYLLTECALFYCWNFCSPRDLWRKSMYSLRKALMKIILLANEIQIQRFGWVKASICCYMKCPLNVRPPENLFRKSFCCEYNFWVVEYMPAFQENLNQPLLYESVMLWDEEWSLLRRIQIVLIAAKVEGSCWESISCTHLCCFNSNRLIFP